MDTQITNARLLQEIEAAAKKITVIDPACRYWFIRTNGGEFYDDFKASKTIGIGYDLVPLFNARMTIQAKGDLGALVDTHYPGMSQPRRAAGLIHRFIMEMKPGDVVVIPSHHSQEFSFGIIQKGEPFEMTEKIAGLEQGFKKRRSVRWVVTKPRHLVEANLRSAFVSYQTLSEATAYGDLIDREMYGLYTKAGRTHIKIEVGHIDGIYGRDYFKMGSAIFELLDDLEAELKLSPNPERIEFKTNVQSPGWLEFISQNSALIIAIASITTVALFGGGLRVKSWGLDLTTPGLFNSLTVFLNAKQRRKLTAQILKAKMAELEVEPVTEMMKALHDPNESPKLDPTKAKEDEKPEKGSNSEPQTS